MGNDINIGEMADIQLIKISMKSKITLLKGADRRNGAWLGINEADMTRWLSSRTVKCPLEIGDADMAPYEISGAPRYE